MDELLVQNRRDFLRLGLACLGTTALAGCGLLPQPPPRPARIGWLSTVIVWASPNIGAFRQGLLDHGYIEGQNLVVEWRDAEGQVERLPELAADLVRSNVDVIAAPSSPVLRAATAATKTIPIVGWDFESEPVLDGFIESLARPGGNLTGLFLDMPGLSGKQLEYLKTLTPGVSRVAVMWDPADAANPYRATESAAQALNVTVVPMPVRGAENLETALTALSTEQLDALIVLASRPLFDHYGRIAELALERRLPTVSLFREFVAAGGLMSYGPRVIDVFARASSYVDRILKGSRPAEMPIERPTQFDFGINLATAQRLGIDIPAAMLSQASEVIR
jgi:putative ABC transport system substrate-binding protein